MYIILFAFVQIVSFASFLIITYLVFFSFFFFNDTATTEIYTLSLHDALPISVSCGDQTQQPALKDLDDVGGQRSSAVERSEEHTSELQSRLHLVCRLLLEKKKKNTNVWTRPG